MTHRPRGQNITSLSAPAQTWDNSDPQYNLCGPKVAKINRQHTVSRFSSLTVNLRWRQEMHSIQQMTNEPLDAFKLHTPLVCGGIHLWSQFVFVNKQEKGEAEEEE